MLGGQFNGVRMVMLRRWTVMELEVDSNGGRMVVLPRWIV